MQDERNARDGRVNVKEPRVFVSLRNFTGSSG